MFHSLPNRARDVIAVEPDSETTVTGFRATVTADQPLTFHLLTHLSSISSLVLSLASFRAPDNTTTDTPGSTSAGEISADSLGPANRKRRRGERAAAVAGESSPHRGVSFLQVRPAAFNDDDCRWWTVAAFPFGTPTGRKEREHVAVALGMRLEVDGTLEFRLLGPGTVTLLGEQYSVLAREDKDHGMFDDDEHDAFDEGDEEDDDDDDDDDDVDGIVFD
jgi:hypothetical protein